MTGTDGNWAAELLPRDPFAGPRAEQYDALADLFLSDSEAPPEEPSARPGPALRLVPAVHGDVHGDDGEPARPAPSRAARIEGLILGHLPVLASAWVMQYARHVAAEIGGPVAVLRLTSDDGVLEVVGAGAAEAAEESGRFETLRPAVEHLAGRIGTWLIRVDEAAEGALVTLPPLDVLTLLAGADQAATVAAYRTLKTLARPAGGAMPEVRLALMGASADRAAAAAAKVARAAETFLQREVRVTACVGKVGGGPRPVLVWAGPSGGGVEGLLHWATDLIASRPVRARTMPARAADSAPPAPPPSRAPQPLHTRVAPIDTQPRAGTLVSHLTGLDPLGFTCPYAPGVEFAIAADGRLHLVALDSAPGDQSSFARLTTAAAWARDHLALLAPAAAAEGRRLADSSPVLHLLTTSAPSVRRLADSGVRLHVLVSTRSGDQTVWACADLN